MTGVDEKDLFTAAYAELHRIARRERRRVSSSATINTTALVHETWFKLGPRFEASGITRNAFLAIAARAMRQVLVDHARRLNAEKRRHLTVTLGKADAEGAGNPSPVAMLELDSALCRLADINTQLARVVDMHVFSGLEFHEIADLEGVSERTVFRLWRNARVFLLDQLAA